MDAAAEDGQHDMSMSLGACAVKKGALERARLRDPECVENGGICRKSFWQWKSDVGS